MANSFSQLHVQFVFAVKFRAALIHLRWKERLHQYITALVQQVGHKMLQINSMPDHIHIIVGMRPTQSVAELVQKIKGESSKWINAQRLCRVKFNWQEGYGAFSYSKDDVPAVILYIKNQEAHHQTEIFIDEYRHLLTENDIEYEEKYLFSTPQ